MLIPPLIKCNNSVMVAIYLREELIELRTGQHYSGCHEGRSELALIQLAVLVSVNALEKLP